MLTTAQVIQTLLRRPDGRKHYRTDVLACLLAVNPSMIWRYKIGKASPSRAVAMRIAELSGLVVVREGWTVLFAEPFELEAQAASSPDGSRVTSPANIGPTQAPVHEGGK